MILRIRSPFYIFFLNPVYVAARSLRSLRSNKTHICVNLGFFSGISSCERQIFDMMKSQLSFVDSVYSKPTFRSKNCIINA